MVRAQPRQRDHADRAADYVLREPARCTAPAARLRTAFLQPPGTQLGKGPRQFLGTELEPTPLQTRPALKHPGWLSHRSEDYVARDAPPPFATPFRASIALTLPAKAFSRTPLPTVASTRPRNRPLRFLPSRTTTRSMSVAPLGRRVKL